MTTTAFIFDLDGVLIDSGAHHRRAWRAVLDELGTEPAEPEFWRLTIGRPSEEAVSLLLGREVSDAEAFHLARRKRAFYVELSRNGFEPVRGVTELVKELAREGVPRAIGTSASRYDVHQILRTAGLARYFDVVVTADDVARGKPDPEVYLVAASRLGVRPGSCLVFEDSIVGIEAARHAGMRSIGVTTAHDAGELIAAGAETTIPDFVGLEWRSIVRP